MQLKKRPIPNKLYFRIGEVSEIVGVKPYVLRYWETEFSDVRPTKSKSGQRLYKRRDVELLLQVRELLYEERYTIDGAKQRLRELLRSHRGDGVAQVTGSAVVQVAARALAQRHLEEHQTAAVPHAAAEDEAEDESEVEAQRPATVARAVEATGHEQKLLIKLKHDLEGLLQELRSS